LSGSRRNDTDGMAVLIASNLRKELSGDPLFDGVSFKLERRDRLALSGPNGAGKTTLLRILAGETELHGGELAFAKGTRVALHARPRPGRRSRPAAPRRADEPPRRPAARVARADASVARRGGDPRRPRPLVPRGGDDGRSRAGGRAVALLPGPVARLAPRE